MRARHRAGLAALAWAVAAPAVAQTADSTGTGGGPLSAAKAPYTTVTGETVPRPGALGAGETASVDRRTREQRQDDSITRGICIGCGPN